MMKKLGLITIIILSCSGDPVWIKQLESDGGTPPTYTKMSNKEITKRAEKIDSLKTEYVKFREQNPATSSSSTSIQDDEGLKNRVRDGLLGL